MTTPLPAIPVEASTWDQALYAFLVEKGSRSGSKRTVESVITDALARRTAPSGSRGRVYLTTR